MGLIDFFLLFFVFFAPNTLMSPVECSNYERENQFLFFFIEPA